MLRKEYYMLKKDDYDVIVYKILKYLYAQFKKGRKLINMSEIIKNLDVKGIEQGYFDNIIETAYRQELIDGPFEEHYFIDEDEPTYEMTAAKITPTGIRFIETSPIMKEVEKYLGITTQIVGAIKP